MTPNINNQPDIKLSIKQTFGIDSNMEVDAFSKKSEYVPEIDKNYEEKLKVITLAYTQLKNTYRKNIDK